MDPLMTSCSVDDSGADDFLGLSGHDYRSSGDLYELVARGGGCLAVSKPHVPRHEVLPPLPVPPSEDEMAGWLHPIITGSQAHAGQGRDHGVAPAKESNKHFMEKLDKKLPTMQNDSARCGGGTRRSKYAVAHGQTEKRRRSKINENLKALQQLVPGCNKLSNQASTLDQTIQYLKSLQHQVQAMSASVDCAMRGVTVAPGIHARPEVVLGAAPPMVPFAPMIPAVMMPVPMVYRPAAAPMYHMFGIGGRRQGTSSSRRKESSLQQSG